MTLEGKFVQQEGVRKITIDINVPHEVFLSMVMIKSQEISKIKNELTFPFVDNILFTILYNDFDFKTINFLWTLSLTSK